MKRQEQIRAVIVSALRAGMKEKRKGKKEKEERRRRKKEIWPPSSPDCNPLDYYVWGVCELHVNKAPHNTVESLVAKIKEVMGNLDRDTVEKACRRFRSRIEAVVAANGDFIE